MNNIKRHKLIILDLDETLIHATESPQYNHWDFEIGHYKVFKRPFLDGFLEELKDYFRVAVWSSASDDYVRMIVENIFKQDYPLEFVWGRSKCTQQFDHQSIDDLGYSDYSNHLNYSKILKKVKRRGYARIEEILIIDDTPRKSRYNYGNAIYPEEFHGQQDDDELKNLLQYLIQIKDVPNFRELEKRNWKEQIKV